jgi:hypothetical protein
LFYYSHLLSVLTFYFFIPEARTIAPKKAKVVAQHKLKNVRKWSGDDSMVSLYVTWDP